MEAYSEAPGDAQNRAAQAHNAAAHQAEPAQNVNAQARGTSKKRVDDASLAKLVAEENASRAKFPRYPGLERWELIEKMGDGAFSNVYRARDLQGDAGEVAIKVVRKYEMNSMQVSVIAFDERIHVALLSHSFSDMYFTTSCCVPYVLSAFEFVFLFQSSFTLLSIARVTLQSFATGYQHLGDCSPNREIGIYIRNSKRLRKQQRCEYHSLLSKCCLSISHAALLCLSLRIRLSVHSRQISSQGYWTDANRFSSAVEHPERSPNHAPTGPPEYNQARRLFRIEAVLLHRSRTCPGWRVVPPDCPPHIL